MKISKRKVKRALVHKSMMGSKPWIGGWNLYPRVSRTSIRWGAGSIPWHPVVVKIWVVQIEISQERLGISKPRKKDPVEWGTSISAASKYSPVRSVIPTHYKNVKCTRVFFLDFLLFLLLLRHHTASLSRGNVFFWLKIHALKLYQIKQTNLPTETCKYGLFFENNRFWQQNQKIAGSFFNRGILNRSVSTVSNIPTSKTQETHRTRKEGTNRVMNPSTEASTVLYDRGLGSEASLDGKSACIQAASLFASANKSRWKNTGSKTQTSKTQFECEHTVSWV